METIAGKVKWYNETSGYGFIAVEGQPDVFVHVREVKLSGLKTLAMGQSVRFQTRQGKNSLKAYNIEVKS